MKKIYTTGIVAVSAVAIILTGASFAARSQKGEAVQTSLAAPGMEVEVGATAEVPVDSVLTPGGTIDSQYTTFTIKNTRDVDEYTRVTVKRIFGGGQQDKLSAKDCINVGLDDEDENWMQAEEVMASDSNEQDVYYFRTPLKAGEAVKLKLDVALDKSMGNEYQNAGLLFEVTADTVQYVEGQNELNARGLLNEFGVEADLADDGSIISLEQ